MATYAFMIHTLSPGIEHDVHLGRRRSSVSHDHWPGYRCIKCGLRLADKATRLGIANREVPRMGEIDM